MLLGRTRECGALDQLLGEARAGRSGVLGLVGDPGIGKTALVDYVVGRADGMRVLLARGVASEATIPFAALAELLRPALGTLDRIPAPQADALSGALAIGPPASRDRFAIGAAVLSLLSAYAEERPLLVVVDDAHWLDRPSASALLFAARRLIADPIAVLVTAREHEPSLLDDSGLRLLRLSGLSRPDVGELLPELKAEAADRLHSATGGNPLALLELAHEAQPIGGVGIDRPAEVSSRLASAFYRRAQRLPAETRQALLVAAAGDSTDLAMLGVACKALGVGIEALAPAEQADLVRITGGELRFRHPLVRAAVYSEAVPADRRAAHAAWAGVLPDRDADRRAWHLAEAAIGQDAHASRALAEAAARARGRTAYEVAARGYERAAFLTTAADRRGALLFEAGTSAALAGDSLHALDLLRQARGLTDEEAAAAAIDHVIGQVTVSIGPVRPGAELIADAAARIAPSDPEAAVVMLAEAVRGGMYVADAALMLRCADRADELAASLTSPRAGFFAAMARAVAEVMGGDAQRGMAAARRALRIVQSTDELQDEPRLLVWAAVTPMWLRDATAGRELIDWAMRRVRVEAALGVLPVILQHLARDQMTTDRWNAAQSSIDEAVRIARECGQTVELAAALAGQAWLEARQGREAECRRTAREALELCEAVGVGFYQVWVRQAMGDLELGLGNAAEAVRRHLEQVALMRSLDFVDVDARPDPELVDGYLRLGRSDEAATAARLYAEAAEMKGQPWALARARRCHGMVSGDGASFEEALALHSQTLDVFETARTHLAYGAALRRARQRVRARDQLHEALDSFVGLGATSWADRASAELTATGEVARRRDVSTLLQLTPQEYQVARLLADGHTTREAAAAMFLSPKTVEYHLRSVYRKLAIQSRDDLTRVLNSDAAGAG